ncbi:hypothetical protein LSH36_679g01006 [Paralvinella palmiformis]|uniref:Uncharacterized protein n=1 Tax=Paralvinella palmiformis TaxID=53620 RepID=A0AAD9J3R6_9ANNE|nr:hypothetical protein LSH36_679g01006 [Paralvinella palmiformis]
MKRVFTRAETMRKKKDENPSSLVRSLMGYGDVEISTYPIEHAHGYHLEHVRFDRALWERMVECFEYFWLKYIALRH